MNQHPNIPWSLKLASFPILVAICLNPLYPRVSGCDIPVTPHISPPLQSTLTWSLLTSLPFFPFTLSVTLCLRDTAPPLLPGTLRAPPLCLEAFPSLCWSYSSFWSRLKCQDLKRSLFKVLPWWVTPLYSFLCFFFLLNTINNDILQRSLKNNVYLSFVGVRLHEVCFADHGIPGASMGLSTPIVAHQISGEGTDATFFVISGVHGSPNFLNEIASFMGLEGVDWKR